MKSFLRPPRPSNEQNANDPAHIRALRSNGKPCSSDPAARGAGVIFQPQTPAERFAAFIAAQAAAAERPRNYTVVIPPRRPAYSRPAGVSRHAWAKSLRLAAKTRGAS